MRPDLTCLGKIIGGGLPVAAYGGGRDVMQVVAPLGPAYQAGTLSGNPLAMTAGIQTLTALGRPSVYRRLEQKGRLLEEGLRRAAMRARRPIALQRVGSVLTPFFTGRSVADYASAATSDREAFAAFFHRMLDQGVYLPPSQFEAWFVSLAHTAEDIERTVAAAERAFAA